MNRSEINRCLAKALAYADCGKFSEAQRWGEVLIRKLELAGVFKANGVRVVEPETLRPTPELSANLHQPLR